MNVQTEIHNRVAGEVVKAIIKPTLAAGGQFSDVLVILESVVLGVMLMAKPLGWKGGSNEVLDELVLHFKKRLARETT